MGYPRAVYQALFAEEYAKFVPIFGEPSRVIETLYYKQCSVCREPLRQLVLYFQTPTIKDKARCFRKLAAKQFFGEEVCLRCYEQLVTES